MLLKVSSPVPSNISWF